MTVSRRHSVPAWLAVLSLVVLAGCATPKNQAPVEERAAGSRTQAPRAAPIDAAAKPALPASSAAVDPRPSTYVVKQGDTLMRIALETGQGWRDIARWNGIDNPNLIEVGQVLKVMPPPAETAVAAASTKPVTAPKLDSKPLDGRPATPASGTAPVATPTVSAAASAVAAPVPKEPVREGDDDIQWAWPAGGSVVAGFDENKSKGLAIGGKAGDPVLAAADGRVVYAGSGLRGYGNLVIVKHNATYLTAYAHNQTLLVKEDQAVKRGQKIAEMGSSDAERVQLHFEIRRQGRPVDPAKMLPSR